MAPSTLAQQAERPANWPRRTARGLTQALKDKARFEAGLPEALREGYEQMSAESESLEEWADEHPEEVGACVLLMDVLGIHGHREGGKPVYERIDDQSKNDLNDFDLHMPDGRRVAVEVTRDISQAARQYEKMVENEDGHSEGFPKTSTALDHHWRIEIEPSPSGDPRTAVRRLQDNIEAMLRRAEELGVDDPCFPESTFPHLTRETKAEIYAKISLRGQLRGLGVRHANHADRWTDHDGPGKLITASLSGPIIWSGPDSINGPVERHLEPNLKKLWPAINDDNAKAHLFIWLQLGDPVSAVAASAMRSMDLSEVKPPDLRGVDSVWLADGTEWSPDLIRRVADETGYLSRRPEMAICRVTADGWERYCCEWRPGTPARGPRP